MGHDSVLLGPLFSLSLLQEFCLAPQTSVSQTFLFYLIAHFLNDDIGMDQKDKQGRLLWLSLAPDTSKPFKIFPRGSPA